jgi:NADH-quinone oxidoreductase subunit L
LTANVAQDSTVLYFALAALLLPVLSFAISFSIPNRYSWAVSLTAPLLLALSFLSACFVLQGVSPETPFQFRIKWFTLGDTELVIGFLLDTRSTLMMVVITCISFLVHLYSTGYMAGTVGIQRYFAMLGFFTFAMMGIVMANNLLMIFFFWELVGFSSYRLIGFWNDKPKAAAAATKAFIINRIGDAGFLVGLMLLWTYTGSPVIDQLSITGVPAPYLTLAGICIFCGVIGKSAQFPLFTWLPDAMEGPTPVSALIHAATMVAAGVFLLARIYFLFTPDVLLVVAMVGAITSVIGAIGAMLQYDIKKILAYSTISQLGLMVMGIGAGNPFASELHLYTHAFFKAGLFLCAGSIIQALHHASVTKMLDVQDIRNMGSLSKRMPVTFFAFLITAGCLAGIPLSAGFLSKDAILTGLLPGNMIFTIIGFGISILTVVYTFRLLWYTFLAKDSLPEHIQKERISDPPLIMRIVTVILAIASLWPVISWSPIDFNGRVSQYAQEKIIITSPFITGTSAFVVLLTALPAYYYYKNKNLSQETSDVPSGNFGFDLLYRKMIVTPLLKLSSGTETLDRKWIDGLLRLGAYSQVALAHLTGWWDKSIIDGSVNSVAAMAKGTGSLTRSFSSGKIQSYILWSMLGLIIFIVWILF